MNQFQFTSKQKTFVFSLMAVGLVSMLLTFFLEPSRYDGLGLEPKYLHTQFWTNFLHNSVFFLGIGFSSVLFIVTHSLAWGGWHTVFKRVPEAMMTFLPYAAALLGVVLLGTAMDWHGIYLWSDKHALATDKLVQHKSSFLNVPFYGMAIVAILVWAFFSYMLRKLSIQEDSKGFAVNYDKKLFYAATFLPIAAFSSAFVIWQVIMSIDVHWYSTMFAWYCTAGMFVTTVSAMVLLLMYLQSKGYFPKVTKEHYHDLGKFVFGISVFWTYLWFSQFMLIWFANNGEETQYFFLRFEQFKPLFFLNLILNFVLPFTILLANYAKRTYGILGFVSIIVILGHWIDFYQMIKPGVWHNLEHAYHAKHESAHGADAHAAPAHGAAAHAAHGVEHAAGAADAHAVAHADLGHFYMGIHFPGLLELGTFAGFLGLFLFVFFTALSKASLQPDGDAYLEESRHHMTGIHDSFLSGDHH